MLSEIMCRRIFQQQRRQDEKLRDADVRRKSGETPGWTAGWTKTCSGRLQSRRQGGPRARLPRHKPRPHRPQRPRRLLRSLRPVNIQGKGARGMQAPQNTNQFLMQEKYQMQQLRSDSVGGDSGCSSDSDLELTDMDSYLGVLENARGGLLDGPEPLPSPGPPGPRVFLQEDSVQYVPSEDDLQLSHNFMQRDFAQFCDFLAA